MYPEVWEHHLGDLLKILSKSQHSKCRLCIRFKLMIRRLTKCSAAREEQQMRLDRHRETQYKDRIVYWHSRSVGRSAILEPFTSPNNHMLHLQQHGSRQISLAKRSVSVCERVCKDAASKVDDRSRDCSRMGCASVFVFAWSFWVGFEHCRSPGLDDGTVA